MRNFNLFILFLLLMGSLHGQNPTQYVIEEVNGTVRVKNDDSETVLAKTKMRIKSYDVLFLEEESFISFYNPKDDKDYRWNKSGSFTVKQIVKEYSKNSLFKTFFYFLFSRKDETPIDNRDWHNTGASIRGSNSESNPMAYETEIAGIIQNNILTRGRRNADDGNDVLLKKVFVSKKVFNFEIYNNTSDSLYFNVFKVLKKGKVSCCFNNIYREENVGIKTMSIFVPAQCKVEFPFYTFFNDKSSFVLIGTKEPFDAQYVEHLVNDSTISIGSSNRDWIHYHYTK